MKMVITTKGGSQIRIDVLIYTANRTRQGKLVSIRWTPAPAGSSELTYVDLAEVAAIHTEYDSNDEDWIGDVDEMSSIEICLEGYERLPHDQRRTTKP